MPEKSAWRDWLLRSTSAFAASTCAQMRSTPFAVPEWALAEPRHEPSRLSYAPAAPWVNQCRVRATDT